MNILTMSIKCSKEIFVINFAFYNIATKKLSNKHRLHAQTYTNTRLFFNKCKITETRNISIFLNINC